MIYLSMPPKKPEVKPQEPAVQKVQEPAFQPKEETKPKIVLELEESKPVSLDKYPVFKKNLDKLPDYYQDFFVKHTDHELIEKLENAKNLEEAVIIITRYTDPEFLENELTNWLDWCEFDLKRFTWQGKKFHQMPPKDQLDAIATYLIRDKGFKYGEISKESYNIANVIEKHEGLCATLPIIFTLVSNRMNMPVHLVTARQHVLCRYDDGEIKYNVESTSKNAMSVGIPDEFYIKDETTGKIEISEIELKASSMLKTLSLKQSIAVLLLNASVVTSRQKMVKVDGEKYPARKHAETEEQLKDDLKYWASCYYFSPAYNPSTKNLLGLLYRNHEDFDPVLINAIRSLAMRKGLISMKEPDREIMLKEIKHYKKKYNDLATKYDVFDTTDKKLVKKVIDLTYEQYVQHYQYMFANRYLFTKPLENDLADIKFKYELILKGLNKLL
jgi:hypothetical protein